MKNKVCRFFMSAVTPKGFVSYMDSLADENKYKTAVLLKGGAGAGKSTLIKKACKSIDGVSELIFCSADPQSLDGAIFEDRKLTFVDATAPHSIEPRLSGIFEKPVCLYDFMDSDLLLSFEQEIKRAAVKEREMNEKFLCYVRAAGMLLSANERIAASNIDKQKLTNYITRLCSREIKRAEKHSPEIKNRFLSTISADGIFMFTDTAETLADKIYAINDECGAVASVILESLTAAALSEGHTVYVCRCPLSHRGRIEHIFIPELSLAFMTSNSFHPIRGERVKNIRISRFFDREKAETTRNRISFQKMCARALLKEAAVCAQSRFECHRRIENYYVRCCDFASRDEYFERFLRSDILIK